MSERAPIFRPEALEHRASQRGPGDVVRVAPRWTSWAFYGLIALFVSSLVAASLIEIDRYATGTTTTDPQGRVVVLLPASLAADVAQGRPVDLGAETARVVSTGNRVLYPTDVRRIYGLDVSVPSVEVVTSAGGSDSTPGSARVLVESSPVIVALVPGLKALFGDEDA